jgi:hypothetical protein
VSSKTFSKPKPRSQFRNHHGPLLRLRFKFLSFIRIFKGSLLPNFRTTVERELLIMEMRYTKTPSTSYIRSCVLCLNVGTKVTEVTNNLSRGMTVSGNRILKFGELQILDCTELYHNWNRYIYFITNSWYSLLKRWLIPLTKGFTPTGWETDGYACDRTW